MNEDTRRLNNKDRVLQALQKAGNDGVNNAYLIVVGGFRYGARIFELRQEGWEIETSQEDGGLFRFVLKGRIQEQPTLFAEMRI